MIVLFLTALIQFPGNPPSPPPPLHHPSAFYCFLAEIEIFYYYYKWTFISTVDVLQSKS